MSAPPRGRDQRRRDTLHRLENDVDAWVASAGDGPYLVPLSFLWDGRTLLFATPAKSPTARNLAATGTVRVGIGLTRDVVLVEGTVAVVEVGAERGDAFAAKAGFDPRTLRTPYAFLEVTPTVIQAWREADELAGRDVMRDGRWVS
jgi:hypothetical protein